MAQQDLRMTAQRRVILEEIRSMDTHPTADQIYELVRRRLPRVSLGTVYRNLELLSAHGLIQKLELGGAQRRFDGNPEAHYHVRCLSCGRVYDSEVPVAADLNRAQQAASDFVIKGHRLEFIGYCRACRQAQTQKGVET